MSPRLQQTPSCLANDARLSGSTICNGDAASIMYVKLGSGALATNSDRRGANTELVE